MHRDGWIHLRERFVRYGGMGVEWGENRDKKDEPLNEFRFSGFYARVDGDTGRCMFGNKRISTS
jgi:hypothetical protein